MVLVIGGIVFALVGFSDWVSGFSHKRQKDPIAITFADLVKKHPSAGWYKVSDVAADGLEGMMVGPASKSGSDVEKVEHVLMPAHDGTRETQKDKAPLLLISSNEDLVAASNKLLKFDTSDADADQSSAKKSAPSKKSSSKFDEEETKKLVAAAAPLYKPRNIVGIVKSESDLYGEDKNGYDQLKSGLTPNPLIFEEGGVFLQPGDMAALFWAGLLMLGLGALGVVYLANAALRGRQV